MRPPEFWAKGGKRAPALEMLLAPVALAYQWAGAARLKNAHPARVSVPVICVGNVTLGGVGKTPMVRAIAKRLRADLIAAHVLLRGYGGTHAGPLRVHPVNHTARDVGDEPLLHALDGPTWIAQDRAAGARAAIEAGAGAIVMDDGFQNPSLAKDLSILVFDSEAGLGNGRVFPAGPSREPLAAALARADMAVLMGNAEAPWLKDFSGPIVRARLEASRGAPPGPLIAFAGIGRPEKFFATLKALGGDISEALPFPDHHVYSPGDRALLDRYATERNATLITTEKDYVRLPADWRASVKTLPVTAVFADEAPLTAALQPLLERARKAR